MKDRAKQFHRAGDDVANKLQRVIAECGPAVQAKFGLTDKELQMAIARGVGLAVMRVSGMAGITLAELGITPQSPVGASQVPTTEITK